MAILLDMSNDTFAAPLTSGTYLVAFECDCDADDNGRPCHFAVLYRSATASDGTALTIEQLADREGLDDDELRDVLREHYNAAVSEEAAHAPDEYYEQAAEFQDEPADLDEGFDPYMGQYTDDC